MSAYYRTHRTPRPPAEPRRAAHSIRVMPGKRAGERVVLIDGTYHIAVLQGRVWYLSGHSGTNLRTLAQAVAV